MQLSAKLKRLTIRYLLEQADRQLRPQILYSVTLGIVALLSETVFGQTNSQLTRLNRGQ